jgi:penicillin G amidase
VPRLILVTVAPSVLTDIHRPRSVWRAVIALVVLAASVAAGSMRLGPALDPLNGIWAVARGTELPRAATGRIPGLSARADVWYDTRDVPHIFAASEEDVYRALGYVVARDRLFQIELQVRAGAGTLTELVGRPALATDQRTRGLGMPRAAERELAALDTASADLRAMRAYADGVNAWIGQMDPADLPIEYRLLGRRPRRWSPVDALHLLNRMSATLSFSDLERRRMLAAEVAGDTVARAVFPVHSPLQQPIVPTSVPGLRLRKGKVPAPGTASAGTELDTIASALPGIDDTTQAVAGVAHRRDAAEGAAGSNNWAVAPRRTKAGYALLAGDPHLDMTLPSLWYEVHLVVPGHLDVAGVTIPGGPGVILGFTRDLAWTFTNTGADVTDYYVEQVDDMRSPRRYLLDGAWRPLELRTEVYRGPRGEVLQVDTVRYTHRGPMRLYAGHWVSMRWTALEGGGAFGALRAGPHAHTTAEWLRVTAGYDVPAQNMLVADRAGSIAIRSTGRYPIRPGDGRGDLVRDGSKSSSDWTGWLPLDRYPAAVNPAQGFLASDNQEPVDPDMPNPTGGAYLGANWETPWRAARINELLRGDSVVTPDEMRRWQTDPGSARADYFVPYFLDAARRADSAGGASAQLREAARLLGEWDRRYTRDNERAVLFEAAMAELSRRAWARLSPLQYPVLAAVPVPSSAVLVELLGDPSSVWWDNPDTTAVETRDDVLAASLAAALGTVTARRGPPGDSGWRWSEVRHANIDHLLHIPAFSRRGLSVQGGTETLSPSSGDGVLGPSWRMVVQLGPEVHGWATYPGGQSGNPLSRRYANRLPQWLAGTLDSVRMPHTPGELAASDVRATLTLEPAR